MASNMTTGDKLKHPITAVKEMMAGKGTSTGSDTTNTKATSHINEGGVHHTGVTHTSKTNEFGSMPSAGVTSGVNAGPTYTSPEIGSHYGQHGYGHPVGQTVGEGVVGTGVVGVGAYEAEKHLGQHGHHTGTGAVAGTGPTGLAGYEAEKHLGHHTGHHTGAGVGTGAVGTGVGAYEAEKHLGHHTGHHTGTNIGTGVAGAGVGGVGAYEAEKHLGGHHHNTQYNDGGALSNTPGLPGTTGNAGQVYTPNMPRPHNVGLTVLGMDTPLDTSDVRSYDNPRAQGGVPTIHTPSHINEERLAATSMPANPLMSALTGGKIPPSIHKGMEQAGVYQGSNTGAHTHTGVSDVNRTGAHDTTMGNTTRTAGVYEDPRPTGYTTGTTRDTI